MSEIKFTDEFVQAILNLSAKSDQSIQSCKQRVGRTNKPKCLLVEVNIDKQEARLIKVS